MIIERQCQDALSSSLHQGTGGRTPADLADGRVEVEEQVLAEELSRAEPHAGIGGARMIDVEDRMSGCERLLGSHPVKGLQVVARGERNRWSGKHHERLRASRE